MGCDPDKHHRHSIRLGGRSGGVFRDHLHISVGWIKRSGSTMDWMMEIVVDPSTSGRLDPPYIHAGMRTRTTRLPRSGSSIGWAWSTVPAIFRPYNHSHQHNPPIAVAVRIGTSGYATLLVSQRLCGVDLRRLAGGKESGDQ